MPYRSDLSPLALSPACGRSIGPSRSASVTAQKRAPRLANVFCGYGHQHLGLKLATATGRLLARLMDGEALPPGLDGCDPGRFG